MVLVQGCSFTGISVAMEKFAEKVSVAVFVSAFMPAPNPDVGYSIPRVERSEFMDSQFSFHDGAENPPTSLLFGPKVMATMLYQLSPPEDLTLGMMLIRPCPLFKDEIVLTREKYGSVPRVYVLCEADEIIKPDMQRWMIESDPTDEVKPIAGADHMVMFSKPHDLCSYLLELASKCV